MEDPEEEKLMLKKRHRQDYREDLQNYTCDRGLENELKTRSTGGMTKYVIINRKLEDKEGVIALATRFHQDATIIIPINYK